VLAAEERRKLEVREVGLDLGQIGLDLGFIRGLVLLLGREFDVDLQVLDASVEIEPGRDELLLAAQLLEGLLGLVGTVPEPRLSDFPFQYG